MTGGMQQDSVVHRVGATVGSPLDVMVLPSDFLADLIPTDRTGPHSGNAISIAVIYAPAT